MKAGHVGKTICAKPLSGCLLCAIHMPFSFCGFVAICIFHLLRFSDLKIRELNKQLMSQKTAYQNGDIANITDP